MTGCVKNTSTSSMHILPTILMSCFTNISTLKIEL